MHTFSMLHRGIEKHIESVSPVRNQEVSISWRYYNTAVYSDFNLCAHEFQQCHYAIDTELLIVAFYNSVEAFFELNAQLRGICLCPRFAGR